MADVYQLIVGDTSFPLERALVESPALRGSVLAELPHLPPGSTASVPRSAPLFSLMLSNLRGGPLPSDVVTLRDLYVESAFYRLEALRDAIEAGPAAAGRGGAGEAISTQCCGDGGVEELAKQLPDPSLPCFGMLRLSVGAGTFAREKTVLVSFAPEACSGIKRAKAAAKKNDVKRLIGDVHAEWAVGVAADLNVGAMLEAVKHIAADTASAAFSIAKMKADYEAMIASSKAAGGGRGGGGGGARAPVDLKSATGRLTAAEMAVKVPSHAALKAVREPLGPFNWALFGPSEPGKELNFVNAGSLSVNECRKWLKEDENYFGVLRMGFGSGMFRRTKWIFFAFSGPKVGVVKRSKAAGAKAHLKAALGHTSVDLQVTEAEELSLEHVIDKVKKIPGVEGALRGKGWASEGGGARPPPCLPLPPPTAFPPCAPTPPPPSTPPLLIHPPKQARASTRTMR